MSAGPRLLASFVVLLVLGAGCLAADEPAPRSAREPATLSRPTSSILPGADAPRVVVAVIDTGINVYHDWFQRGESLSDEILAQFTDATKDEAPVRVPISTQGTYWDRLSADNATWNSLEPRKLYYVEGTNILGISFATKTATQRPVIDEGGHGSGTAGAVMKANPKAIVVLIESFNREAEAWAAAQPWIDFTSMSYGPTGSIPTGAVTDTGTHVHTKATWARGAIPVGAADNTPSLAPNDETAGPPWVVGVAGDRPSAQCRSHISGTFPDFTSDFTQTLPMHRDTNRTRSMSGTSFATPKTAGVFSAVLLEVRTAWNHTGGIQAGAMAIGPDGQRLTNWGLREAFNRTATYFPTTTCGGDPVGSQPVNPVAPWAQMGWGHIEYDSVNATVAHILGTKPAPDKPQARAFQGALIEYRYRLWN